MLATKGRMPANWSSVVYPLRAPISLVNETGTTPKTLKPALLSFLALFSLFLLVPEEIVITPPIESCIWISRKLWIKNKPEDESLKKLKSHKKRKMKSALHNSWEIEKEKERQTECVWDGRHLERQAVWVTRPYWIDLSVRCLRWISFAIACCRGGASKTDTHR